jgi:phage shock protein A
MAETKSKTEMLIAQHRRAKLAQRSGLGIQEFQQDAAMDRARLKVAEEEARGLAAQVMGAMPDVDQRMAALEKSDQVDRLLAELKSRTLLLPK